MKLFSYTDTRYTSPPAALNDDRWPVQCCSGFSEFYHRHYSGHLLLVHDPETDAWLPFHLRKRGGLKFGQILMAPVKAYQELEADEQRAYLNKLVKFVTAQSLVDRFIQPHPMGIMRAHPENSKAAPFGTYVTPLQEYPDNEALLNSYDSKYRKAIQHAQKNGARIVFGREAWDDFYGLYEQTAQRTGMYQDQPEYFMLLRKYLGSGHSETGVVYDGPVPVGGIFMMYSRYAALCTHAGSTNQETKLYGAIKLLHYEMMKRMRDLGVQRYDLVGVRIQSKNPALEGVFRFKRGFGGILQEGYLWKTDIATLSTYVYDLMQQFRHTTRKPDIIDQENEESKA